MSIIITAIIATILLVSISTSIVIANSIVSQQQPPQQQNANMQFILQAIEVGVNTGFVSVILYLLVRLYAMTNEQIKILLLMHDTLTDLKTCMVRIESKLDKLIDDEKDKYNSNKEEEEKEEERDGGN